MNPVAAGLAAAVGLAGLAALSAVLGRGSGRARVTGALTSGSGAAGAVAGVAAVTGTGWHATWPDLLPLAGLNVAVDALSGWFLVLVGAVTAIVGGYLVGYAGRTGRGPASRTGLLLLPVFTTAMLLVPVAGSVSSLLLCWELMAVASLLLVLTEHQHDAAVRTAGVWYAAMTQAGFVVLLIGLLWLARLAGSDSFTGIRAVSARLPPVAASGLFLLCLAGFAAKAGAVPLHAWLPRAHAEAPSHVSALMSAAMVKLGVYGLLRVGFDLLGGGRGWWWLAVAMIGGVSALHGIMQAALATDLKRLLAFSTTENVGLILLGIGFAGLLWSAGNQAGASLAMAAALLHTANHAGFKTLLFTGAGSVVRATGTRDLDRLGGLSRRMPATTALVAGGALAAAALPPGNGFVSEWLLLQAFLHPGAGAGTVVTIAAPIAVAVVALTAGIGVVTYVKVVGVGFLARPRSDGAARAVESPPAMLVAMGAAALVCLALAMFPAVLAPALDRVGADLGVGSAPIGGGVSGLTLPGMASEIRPLWILVALVLGSAGLATAARLGGRARRRAVPWDCGDGPLTARMQSTATSFAEPLQRVFDNVLAPERGVEVTRAVASDHYVHAMRYSQRIPDRIEDRLYRPVIALVAKIGGAARGIASGSMHRYLVVMLTTLIAILVAGILR